MKSLISIFTPTYNRAHTLSKLYESLLAQSFKNFEWILVDDGSKDETEELVNSWISEAKIPIVYEKKKNEGKHIAINRGVELAKGELFFIVDSDDYLTVDATEKITTVYPKVQNKTELGGLSFRRGYTETQFIGSQEKFNDIEANIFDFRYQYKIKGDMAEVYKTEVIKQFPFPKIENEKFCAEGLIWNRIGLEYKLLWTSEIIYICEYLEGGLTDNSVRLRKQSPNYATLYYSELVKAPVAFQYKMKAMINYWRFAFYQKASFSQKLKRVNLPLTLLAFPLSVLFYFKDRK